jgi:hypothetical protein
MTFGRSLGLKKNFSKIHLYAIAPDAITSEWGARLHTSPECAGLERKLHAALASLHAIFCLLHAAMARLKASFSLLNAAMATLFIAITRSNAA